jgi:hypothetical protein
MVETKKSSVCTTRHFYKHAAGAKNIDSVTDIPYPFICGGNRVAVDVEKTK